MVSTAAPATYVPDRIPSMRGGTAHLPTALWRSSDTKTVDCVGKRGLTLTSLNGTV